VLKFASGGGGEDGRAAAAGAGSAGGAGAAAGGESASGVGDTGIGNNEGGGEGGGSERERVQSEQTVSSGAGGEGEDPNLVRYHRDYLPDGNIWENAPIVGPLVKFQRETYMGWGSAITCHVIPPRYRPLPLGLHLTRQHMTWRASMTGPWREVHAVGHRVRRPVGGAQAGGLLSSRSRP